MTLKIRPADPQQLQQSYKADQSQRITIIVEDAAGNPVEHAAVSFRLPDQGPTGFFANGLRSEIAITGSDGRATIAPIRWGAEAGEVPLRVTTAKGVARAGAVLQVQLIEEVRAVVAQAPKAAPKPIVLGAMVAPTKAETPVDLQTPKYDPPGFWKSRWFLMALAAGGAVAAGFAVTKLGGSQSAIVTNPIIPGNINQVPVVIGPPLITVGKP